MAREIHVTIEKGKATVETTGFTGTACQDATKDLEAAMGVVEDDQKTPEWHMEEVRTAPQ